MLVSVSPDNRISLLKSRLFNISDVNTNPNLSEAEAYNIAAEEAGKELSITEAGNVYLSLLPEKESTQLMWSVSFKTDEFGGMVTYTINDAGVIMDKKIESAKTPLEQEKPPEEINNLLFNQEDVINALNSVNNPDVQKESKELVNILSRLGQDDYKEIITEAIITADINVTGGKNLLYIGDALMKYNFINAEIYNQIKTASFNKPTEMFAEPGINTISTVSQYYPVTTQLKEEEPIKNEIIQQAPAIIKETESISTIKTNEETIATYTGAEIESVLQPVDSNYSNLEEMAFQAAQINAEAAHIQQEAAQSGNGGSLSSGIFLKEENPAILLPPPIETFSEPVSDTDSIKSQQIVVENIVELLPVVSNENINTPLDTAGPKSPFYIIQQGDTLENIALYFNTSVEAIVNMNPVGSYGPGQIIEIRERPENMPSDTLENALNDLHRAAVMISEAQIQFTDAQNRLNSAISENDNTSIETLETQVALQKIEISAAQCTYQDLSSHVEAIRERMINQASTASQPSETYDATETQGSNTETANSSGTEGAGATGTITGSNTNSDSNLIAMSETDDSSSSAENGGAVFGSITGSADNGSSGGSGTSGDYGFGYGSSDNTSDMYDMTTNITDAQHDNSMSTINNFGSDSQSTQNTGSTETNGGASDSTPSNGGAVFGSISG